MEAEASLEPTDVAGAATAVVLCVSDLRKSFHRGAAPLNIIISVHFNYLVGVLGTGHGLNRRIDRAQTLEIRLGLIRQALRHPRRRFVVLLVVIALCGLLATAHSAPSMKHMDIATVICFAVFAGTTALATASPVAVLMSRRADRRIGTPLTVARRTPARRTPVLLPPARAGPLSLQVLRL